MSRTHRFLGGVSLGYVYLVLVTVVGLWLTPFLLHRIGQHDLGLWLLATQILGYLMLLDFGVVALLPREAAYATGRALGGQPGDVGETVGRFRRIVRWQMPLVVLVALGVWVALPANWAELRGPLVGILATFVITFPLRIYHAALQGLQDHAYLGRVQLVAWTAGTAVTVALVVAGVGLVALVAGWAVTQLVSAAACGWRLRHYFKGAWLSTPPAVGWPVARRLLSQSSWVSAAQVAQVFLNGTDVLIIGRILGPLAVVPYACTTKLVTVLANHPQLLMQTAAPALSELRAGGNRERLAEVCSALTRAMLILSGGVACLVLAVNHIFVQWWVGPGQFAGSTLTALVVASLLLRHLNTTCVYALFAFGHERPLSLTALADGAVTLVLSAWLVTRYGLIGGPLGSLIGVLAVSLPINLWRLSAELGVRWTQPLINLRGWAVRFTVSAGVSVGLSRLVDQAGFWPLVASSALAMIVYVAVMWTLALQPPLGEYVRAALVPLSNVLGGKWPDLRASRP